MVWLDKRGKMAPPVRSVYESPLAPPDCAEPYVTALKEVQRELAPNPLAVEPHGLLASYGGISASPVWRPTR